MSLIQEILNSFAGWLGMAPRKEKELKPFDEKEIDYLSKHVAFYKALNAPERKIFERRIQLFLATTDIVGSGIDVSYKDRLLVAAGAIIPVWRFPNWHYFNLQEVILVPGSFNESSEFNQTDSSVQGVVGTGHLSGKMILSQPALHYGFSNDRDKRNVAIHEFAHLIDMADGDCDGFPERLLEYTHAIPWFDLVYKKIEEINDDSSNINPYGARNKIEFFAVATEYFFERPKMLESKHPQLYQALSKFYKQDVSSIQQEIEPRKKGPCPCGSGKRYKRCCFPKE